MKWMLGSLLGITLLVTGCASRYVITLDNGSQINVKGKPRREGSYYVYKDAKGQPVSVLSWRVREIAPASMASPSHRSGN